MVHTTTRLLALLVCLGGSVRAANPKPAADPFVEITAEDLRDKIRGGLLGQILGNLNGLPHEMKYIDQPGNVDQYTPSLPRGARTDDDTDFEWVYVIAMQDQGERILSPSTISSLWRERMNRGLWCANRYARHLMDLGLEPPWTGSFALNPWAEFNISGQFLCETFALLAPAMPQTASELGLHYTRVSIDGEPAQTTQLFCTMISSAFILDDLEQILDRGLAALDPNSQQRQIVADVRRWHLEHPKDWRQTRRLLQEKYTQAAGGMRDRNGFELTTGSTVAALLYGDGDFCETLRTAFNFGWDADNTAATAGTIIGVMQGYRAMLSQGWQIVDRYQNTTRDGMPMDETITSYADRLIDLAERIIVENGGTQHHAQGRLIFRIPVEQPANVYALSSPDQLNAALRSELEARIAAGLVQDASLQQQAQAAYLAICLNTAEALSRQQPSDWQRAVDALKNHTQFVDYLLAAEPNTAWHQELKRRAEAAGLQRTRSESVDEQIQSLAPNPPHPDTLD